jgi:hypothetical protein
LRAEVAGSVNPFFSITSNYVEYIEYILLSYVEDMPIDNPISRADIDKSAEQVYTTEEIEQKCDAPDRVRYVSLSRKGRSEPERRIVTAKGRKRATATSGGWKPKCIVRLCSAVMLARENLCRRANLAVHAR